jgi:hypothetical protein
MREIFHNLRKIAIPYFQKSFIVDLLVLTSLFFSSSKIHMSRFFSYHICFYIHRKNNGTICKIHHQIILSKNNNNNSTQFSKAQFTLEMEGGVNTCNNIKFLLLVRFAFTATKKT